MQIKIMSFLTGLVVGIIFKFFKLPVPAPNVIEGVLGIIGIYSGYTILK